jgi:hypothetical protein
VVYEKKTLYAVMESATNTLAEMLDQYHKEKREM